MWQVEHRGHVPHACHVYLSFAMFSCHVYLQSSVVRHGVFVVWCHLSWTDVYQVQTITLLVVAASAVMIVVVAAVAVVVVAVGYTDHYGGYNICADALLRHNNSQIRNGA